MRSVGLFILSLLVGVQIIWAEEPSLLKALEGVAGEIAQNEEALGETALQGALHGVYRSEGLASMIQLWKSGKQWPAELAWWRSPYPNARKLAIALFYTSYPDTDVPQVPRFEAEAGRFGEVESKQRKDEVAEVVKNLPEIKKRLEPLLKDG